MHESVFRMVVADIFHIKDFVVFAGSLETKIKYIHDVKSSLLVDGVEVGELVIGGEVHVLHSRARDLWTRNNVDIDREVLDGQEVLLVSP